MQDIIDYLCRVALPALRVAQTLLFYPQPGRLVCLTSIVLGHVYDVNGIAIAISLLVENGHAPGAGT